jgi:hypothetical protein
MNINFENLEKIDEIYEMLKQLTKGENKIEKRWLNVSETAYYLGYSKDYIHKLKDNSLYINKHYYKKSGKLLFDKYELDNWITSFSPANNIDSKGIADELLKGLI